MNTKTKLSRYALTWLQRAADRESRGIPGTDMPTSTKTSLLNRGLIRFSAAHNSFVCTPEGLAAARPS